jgi:hypothetical protein
MIAAIIILSQTCPAKPYEVGLGQGLGAFIVVIIV